MNLSKLKKTWSGFFNKGLAKLKAAWTEIVINIHSIIFIAGLALLDMAAFSFGTSAGLAAAGAFFILIAFILDKGVKQ